MKVTFLEAINSGKRIKSEFDDTYGYQSLTSVLKDLSGGFSEYAINRINGAWYTEGYEIGEKIRFRHKSSNRIAFGLIQKIEGDIITVKLHFTEIEINKAQIM